MVISMNLGMKYRSFVKRAKFVSVIEVEGKPLQVEIWKRESDNSGYAPSNAEPIVLENPTAQSLGEAVERALEAFE